MVFNATFNNISVISWWSVLLVEETGLSGENRRPVAIYVLRQCINIVIILLKNGSFFIIIHNCFLCL